MKSEKEITLSFKNPERGAFATKFCRPCRFCWFAICESNSIFWSKAFVFADICLCMDIRIPVDIKRKLFPFFYFKLLLEKKKKTGMVGKEVTRE